MAGLNLDIAGKVSELEILLKKVLPKNVMWRVVLGRGLEFDGYKDYSYDYDSSTIDWKASVRAKKLLVKKFVEERDRKFMFFLDTSESMVFGSTEKIKCEYAAELTAALTHLILYGGDKVGFGLFGDGVKILKKPKMGNKQFDILVHELSNPENYGGPSSLENSLSHFMGITQKDLSMVFLISDFINFNDGAKKNLEYLGGLFETIAIIVRDPLDRELPKINKEIVIENSFSDQKILINPKIAGNVYKANSKKQLDYVKKCMSDFNIDFIEIYTDESFPEKIAEFLRTRIRGGKTVNKNAL